MVSSMKLDTSATVTVSSVVSNAWNANGSPDISNYKYAVIE